jgi:polyhydroxyalkanoate synthase
MLRPNDLIWNYVTKNYLRGEAPIPFDILYWNSDSANIPGEMYAWYLKNTYLENRLAEANGVTLDGRPIDMGAIKTPCYFLATVEDHIVLWQGAYKGARLMGGPVRFVLAESGHVAGVVNPPHKKKYGHHTSGLLPDTAEAWQEKSIRHSGSWWLDWAKWLKPKSGKKVPSRNPDNAPNAFGPAPGTYVKRRLEPKKRCRTNCSCQKNAGDFPMLKT